MTPFSPSRIALAVPFALMSQAALADLTPQDVWNDIRQYLESGGFEITMTQDVKGGDVVISDLEMNLELPPEVGLVSIKTGPIEYVANGDGTVSIVMAEEMPIALRIVSQDGSENEADVLLNYTQTGRAAVASGDPDDITYNYSADMVSLVLDELIVIGNEVGRDMATVEISATDVRSTSSMKMGDLRSVQQSTSIGELAYNILINDPEIDTLATFEAAMTGLTINGGGDVPVDVSNIADANALIKAGFDVAGEMAFETTASKTYANSEFDGEVKADIASGNGSLNFRMGSAGVGYGVTQNDLSVQLESEELPFPVDVSIQETGFNLQMPVLQSDAEQPFALAVKLAGVALPEMLWSMGDPSGQLDRGPVTIDVDVSGDTVLLADLFDPESAEAMAFGPPAELRRLALNKLLVAAVGASVSGNGEITINPDGPPMIPGVGAPVGSVEVAVSGANALLDKLIEMGIVPEDDAMGARMMMGLFGVAGAEPDTLTSTIEITEDGQILANGQRIQ
jgi:hypothetical protein